MAKVKAATLFIIVLLLLSTLTYAARPAPAFENNHPPANTQQVTDAAGGDDNCEGEGEEDCLTKRSLAAHLDYIYTQNHKP